MNSQLPDPDQRLLKTERVKTRLIKVWPAVLIVGAWLWLFWPMISGQAVCGFRDSAYLYYPFFNWIDGQWAAGEIPLWNPYDRFGTPVVADESSSVFYPGKLIFLFRFLSYESRYGLYLAIHVLVAASGCYWLARRMGCKQGGATIAAVGYAFGGSVLFQVCNVIFLVGAAWLPAALGSLWLMLNKKSLGWAVAGGVFCTLILLGGDPQMVYNIGLIGLGTVGGKFWGEFFRARRLRHRQGDLGGGAPVRDAATGLGRLSLLVVVTAVLSAVQILPSIEWAASSERAFFQQPRSIYELPFSPPNMNRDRETENSLASLFRTPLPTTHYDHVFQFSQPPWSIVELLVPNLSGQPFPINGRWSAALPGADRMWVPSLYSGCLVAIFGMLSFRLWGKRRRQVWLSRVGLFFVLGSFGWYGLGWLAGEFVDLSSSPFELGPQVGGVYWVLVIGLPKYVLFRYPAKLFVIGSLALCVLAGLGMNRIRLRASSGWVKCLTCIPAICFLTVIVLSLISKSLLGEFWESVPADPLFGPFASSTATWALQFAFFQVIVITLTGLFVILKICDTGRSRFWMALTLIAMIDVLLANYWMVASVKSDVFTQDVNRVFAAPPLHILPYPVDWLQESSHGRLEEIVTWQRMTLFPKHHLEVPIQHRESFSSIEPRRADQRSLEEPNRHDAFYLGAWISGFGLAVLVLVLVVRRSVQPRSAPRLQR